MKFDVEIFKLTLSPPFLYFLVKTFSDVVQVAVDFSRPSEATLFFKDVTTVGTVFPPDPIENIRLRN